MGQAASDVYLPAMPAIKAALGTTEHLIQLSLSLFMFGFAASHLIYGPLSDGAGRKKPLIIGTVICLIGTVICQETNNIILFIFGRFLQGAGAGASSTLYRSILRDVYSGNHLAKIGSIMGISRILILATSPLIGSYILHYFGWRACFTFILIYAGACLLGAIFTLKETNQYTHLHENTLKEILGHTKTLLSHPVFMGYSLCIMITFGGILAWLTVLPFILQTTIGLTPIQFGWVSAIAGLFFAVGGFANAMLVEKQGLNKMLKIGLIVMFIGGLVMLGFGLSHTMNTLVVIIPVIIYILGSSMIFANAYAGAFHPFPKIAGTAGAIFGFLQILGGAISSGIMSFTHTYNQTPLSIALIATAVVGFFIAHFIGKYETATDIDFSKPVL